MALLFCFAFAYLVVRLWEDLSARWRHETPPRHEYRMAKLKERQDNGGTVPQSSLGRYVTGLFDDVWDSAHERRELGAERRRAKRERKADKKLAKEHDKRDRQDAKLAAKDGAPAQPEAIGFTAEVPDEDATSPAAAPLPQPQARPATVPAAEQAGPEHETPSLEPLGFTAEVPDVDEYIHPSSTSEDGAVAATSTHSPLGHVGPVLPGEGDTSRDTLPARLIADLSDHQREVVERCLGVAPDSTGSYTVSRDDWFGLPTTTRAWVLHWTATHSGWVGTSMKDGQPLSIAEWDPGAHDALLTLGGRVPRVGWPDGEGGISPDQPAATTAAVGTTAPDSPPKEADSTASTASVQRSNVIPFPAVSTSAAQIAAAKEYPMVNGESTGLDQAIQYASDLKDYLIAAQDGIVAAAPNPDELAQSCEQAQADLTLGGVTGETLGSVSQVQESVIKAAQAVKDAVAQFEAAAAAAQTLHTNLTAHTGVQEAYLANQDAGSREFVTNGAL
ncbi:hypothetical protein AB0F91_39890 [Amycolatopsis sp. NPDC023774]|uniref:hypothetical protein n=1 Tax=Amycolatopsis sp. NPDC023774 TaxID=3155015 RepID=UPI003404C4A0